MTNFSTSPQNRIQYDPQLIDILNLHKKDILLSLNCHAVATIQSFDSAKQTVTATINYTKTLNRPDPKTGVYGPVQVEYPVLIDCPIYILGDGKGCSLTFPIKVGATCSILFNDRDLDNWLTSGQIGPLSSSRLHSLADGIALIGLRSATDVIQNYDTVRAVLQNGVTLVGVGATKVKVANNSTTLNTLLQSLVTDIQNLCTALEALTVTCAAPGNPSSVPINAAAIAAVSTSLGTLGTQIAGLLE